ncbi:MAG: DUF4288 domain-containing protein [Candidatus Hydrogenedentes bacterium]|nr:DUF4288 domain-containing protein [Candidatus Hydrogenedentota bacterium]
MRKTPPLWYTAHCLYVCEVAKRCCRMREIRVFLIKESSKVKARAKAKRIAKGQEVSYKNSDGAVTRWRFVRVLNMGEIYDDDLDDGIEIESVLQWEFELAEMALPACYAKNTVDEIRRLAAQARGRIKNRLQQTLKIVELSSQSRPIFASLMKKR